MRQQVYTGRASGGRRLWLAGASLLLVCAVLSRNSPRPVHAQTAPVNSISRYINDLKFDSTDPITMENWGCADEASDPLKGGAALDFGQPWEDYDQYGNLVKGVFNFSAGGRFMTDVQVWGAVDDYLYGWSYCDQTHDHSQKQLGLAVSVSNLVGYVNADHGYDWGLNVVTDVETYVQYYGMGNNVMAGAGLDAEVEYDTYLDTQDWESGYLGANCQPGNCPTSYPFKMSDVGDASGCPTSGTGPNQNLTCYVSGNITWRQADVWSIASGCDSGYCTYVMPAPAIYANGGANAEQWQQISLWACDNEPDHGCLGMSGSLTQSYACSQRPSDPYCNGTDQGASQGWTELYNAMTCNGAVPCPTSGGAPTYDSDIRWDQ